MDSFRSEWEGTWETEDNEYDFMKGWKTAEEYVKNEWDRMTFDLYDDLMNLIQEVEV